MCRKSQQQLSLFMDLAKLNLRDQKLLGCTLRATDAKVREIHYIAHKIDIPRAPVFVNSYGFGFVGSL